MQPSSSTKTLSLLGQRIDEYRAEHELTIGVLARRLRISRAMASRSRYRYYAEQIEEREGLAEKWAALLEMSPAQVQEAAYEPADEDAGYHRPPRRVTRSRAGSEPVKTFPVRTGSGIKWQATIDVRGGCEQCEHLEACAEEIRRWDGFALCEGVISEELVPMGEGEVDALRAWREWQEEQGR